ncbi:hypothetical protein H0H81_003547 [Sphagnurus paluster]|uniref:Uncharacterized protein n=1 Tax=Sphagnurus paluster TaxID=117069 RepID=A0A9P7KH96_9AGAR|nr:hypothetical protein H0H81_003547 [Sphagnurus paluster]
MAPRSFPTTASTALSLIGSSNGSNVEGMSRFRHDLVPQFLSKAHTEAQWDATHQVSSLAQTDLASQTSYSPHLVLNHQASNSSRDLETLESGSERETNIMGTNYVVLSSSVRAWQPMVQPGTERNISAVQRAQWIDHTHQSHLSNTPIHNPAPSEVLETRDMPTGPDGSGMRPPPHTRPLCATIPLPPEEFPDTYPASSESLSTAQATTDWRSRSTWAREHFINPNPNQGFVLTSGYTGVQREGYVLSNDLPMAGNTLGIDVGSMRANTRRYSGQGYDGPRTNPRAHEVILNKMLLAGALEQYGIPSVYSPSVSYRAGFHVTLNEPATRPPVADLLLVMPGSGERINVTASDEFVTVEDVLDALVRASGV